MDVLYLHRPANCDHILLKVIRVLLHHGDHTLNIYAILDDGLECIMLLPDAAQKLGLEWTPEKLALRTNRQDIQTLHGASVTFHISPALKDQFPDKRGLHCEVGSSGRASSCLDQTWMDASESSKVGGATPPATALFSDIHHPPQRMSCSGTLRSSGMLTPYRSEMRKR